MNNDKQVFLYGDNSRLNYYELNNKYYNFNLDYWNEGTMSIFVISLILSKLNDTYTIYNLRNYISIWRRLLNIYKSFGIKALNYEYLNYDNWNVKFVF